MFIYYLYIYQLGYVFTIFRSFKPDVTGTRLCYFVFELRACDSLEVSDVFNRDATQPKRTLPALFALSFSICLTENTCLFLLALSNLVSLYVCLCCLSPCIPLSGADEFFPFFPSFLRRNGMCQCEITWAHAVVSLWRVSSVCKWAWLYLRGVYAAEHCCTIWCYWERHVLRLFTSTVVLTDDHKDVRWTLWGWNTDLDQWEKLRYKLKSPFHCNTRAVCWWWDGSSFCSFQ